MSTRPHSTLWLVGRSLLPSTTSIAGCVFFSIMFAAAGTLLSSVNAGTFLPNVLEGDWAATYTNTIVKPLESATNSQKWDSAAIIVLWGLVGLLVYTLLEHTIFLARDWRTATREIQVTRSGAVLHPLERDLLIRLLWRLLTVVAGFVAIVLLHPMIVYAFKAERQLVLGLPLMTALGRLAKVIFVWILVAHVCLVFARLFTLRTRLFGDDAVLQ